MKMQMSIRAPVDGMVKAIFAPLGAVIENGDILIELQ
jgi:biotin carboxyl carrier protein